MRKRIDVPQAPRLAPPEPWGLRMPMSTPEFAAPFIAKIMQIRGRAKPGPRDWAYRLRTSELAGEQMQQCQRNAWREVLSQAVAIDQELLAERAAIQAEGA